MNDDIKNVLGLILGLVVVYIGFWIYYGLYLLVTGQPGV
jgi:hypothetical protein